MGLMGVSSASIGVGPTGFLVPEGLWGDVTVIALESLGQYVAPKAGTISRIKGKIFANILDDTTTITLRINGVDTALTVTIPAGSTADFTIPGSVAVAEDDLISWRVVRPSTVGSLSGLRITYDYN